MTSILQKRGSAARGTRQIVVPVNSEHSDRIRAELDRILSSSYFQNSKRYPNLLKYVVEQALQGNTDLKERTLGVEVFGRTPDYDSNADPVVRITAAEVRKRLAQYFQEFPEDSEYQIEIPPGSYVPEFRRRISAPAPSQSETTAAPVAAAEAAAQATPSMLPDESEKIAPRHRKFYAAALLCLILAGAAWTTSSFIANRLSPIKEFWGPIVNSSGTAILCIGDYQTFAQDHPQNAGDLKNREAVPAIAFQSEFGPQDPVATADMKDVMALTKTASFLQSMGKEYRVTSSYIATLADLRQGPVVLIGGLNNRWTMKVNETSRFSLELGSSGTARIVDRQDPSRSDLTIPFSQIYAKDYSIVERLNDPTTGSPVIIAAGLGPQGTLAAVEFVTTPDRLSSFLKDAPHNWQKMNMEAVIQSEVIEGKVGPPRVIAVQYW